MEHRERPQEPRTRVVVTGVGAITAAGGDAAALRAALHGERTCIRDVTLFDTDGLRVHIAGEVSDVPEPRLLPRAARVRASRSDRFALLAAEEALAHAGLSVPFADPRRLGVAIGSSTGGMLETESYFRTRLAAQTSHVWRRRLAAATVAAPTDLVAAVLGARGPRLSPSTACSSGAIALALAAAWIRSGAVDVAVAGGSDALTRMTYTGFHALQALSSEPCRPFDRERRGLSLGEGAGILVLESEQHARARGAVALAELAGAGMSCDASHPTAPHGEARGAVLALESALRDAGVRPGEIDYVNAHGTGTVQNDASETLALKRVLGEAAPRVAVSSTKALIGHLLGAAGAVEAIATIIAIDDRWAPPTLHLREPDPACDLDYVPNRGRPLAIATALSNSYGFGGNNCSLVLRRA
ncbi:beta-ketoacyl-[acyl-carrier-protein] synthase family protein [Candidatus Binatia bacterium]|nr:beta-ketoacyl-[acyl-carrier-protein] synthase family protein [Candidatus Binatia bacterium]